MAQIPAVTLPDMSVPAARKGIGSKFILAVVALVAVFACASVAGILYVGYRAKKKVDEIRRSEKQDDTASLLKAITGSNEQNKPGNEQGGPQSGQNDAAGAAVKTLVGNGAEALMKKVMGVNSAEAPKLPEWKPAPADLISSPASKISLRVSLRLVVAGTEPARGDYESIFLLDGISGQQIHFAGSQQFPNPPSQSGRGGSNGNAPQQARKIKCGHTEFKADLENSAESSPYVCWNGREDKFPGTTSFSISRKSFMDLKTTGDTPFLAHENPMNALFKSFKDIASGTGSSADFLNRVLSAAPGGMAPPAPPVRYTLHRVGQDVSFPVLVNDQPAQLPAMQVSCLHADGTSGGDVYILDDADNPLILAEQTELNGTGQIIKIYWDFPKRTGLEEELAENGRAKVYDLYFDFRSDVLRPESDKVLKEIAQVMQDHPDWKLTVEGHTDNIGDDASNLDLSKRRAAAVKQALVTKYGVAAGRLLTDGFGRSRPVDTNDTLEGRAHNRRVELVKQ